MTVREDPARSTIRVILPVVIELTLDFPECEIPPPPAPEEAPPPGAANPPLPETERGVEPTEPQTGTNVEWSAVVRDHRQQEAVVTDSEALTSIPVELWNQFSADPSDPFAMWLYKLDSWKYRVH